MFRGSMQDVGGGGGGWGGWGKEGEGNKIMNMNYLSENAFRLCRRQ